MPPPRQLIQFLVGTWSRRVNRALIFPRQLVEPDVAILASMTRFGIQSLSWLKRSGSASREA